MGTFRTWLETVEQDFARLGEEARTLQTRMSKLKSQVEEEIVNHFNKIAPTGYKMGDMLIIDEPAHLRPEGVNSRWRMILTMPFGQWLNKEYEIALMKWPEKQELGKLPADTPPEKVAETILNFITMTQFEK